MVCSFKNVTTVSLKWNNCHLWNHQFAINPTYWVVALIKLVFSSICSCFIVGNICPIPQLHTPNTYLNLIWIVYSHPLFTCQNTVSSVLHGCPWCWILQVFDIVCTPQLLLGSWNFMKLTIFGRRGEKIHLKLGEGGLSWRDWFMAGRLIYSWGMTHIQSKKYTKYKV